MTKDVSPNPVSASVDRRGLMRGGALLGGAAVLGSGLTLSACAGEAEKPAFAMPDTTEGMNALARRMRLRADAGTLFWWFRGEVLANRDAVLTPICNMLFGAMMKVEPQEDGTLSIVQMEVGFRTDPETGKRLKSVVNPFTKEEVAIPYSPVGPTHMSYDKDNHPVLPDTIGGSTFTLKHTPTAFELLSDTVAMRGRTEGTLFTPGKPDRHLNDMSTFFSPAAIALDPTVGCAPCHAAGSDVGGYSRWLNMPEGMGSQTIRTIGEKVTEFTDLPQDFLEMIEQEEPDLIRDPNLVFTRPQKEYKN